jgi:hypothetical protein
MTTNEENRRETVSYWEKRRILFNVLIVLTAGFLYLLRTSVSAGAGDTRYLTELQIAGMFLITLITANLCYSFVYALEFLIGSSNAASGWKRYGRLTVFLAGCVCGIVFAVFAAGIIGGSEYNPPPGWHPQE